LAVKITLIEKKKKKDAQQLKIVRSNENRRTV